MMSSLATLFPFSVGGLGIREIASQWGASTINLDENLSVLLSLCFYLVTALVALSAIYILFDRKKFPAADAKEAELKT